MAGVKTTKCNHHGYPGYVETAELIDEKKQLRAVAIVVGCTHCKAQIGVQLDKKALRELGDDLHAFARRMVALESGT